jgi:amino acid transporter
VATVDLQRQRAAEPKAARFEASDLKLRRSMSLTQALFLSVGSIIGSGWLFAALGAASYAGPAAIVSWVVGGVFIILIALSWSEVAAMLPRTGGLVRYPQLTHGSFTGWILGWGYWVSAIATPAIEAEAVITYISGRYPSVGLTHQARGTTVLSWPWGIWCAIGLMIIFFCVNVFGVRLLSETNKWVTWWKIVIPTCTFAFLFTVFRSSNFSAFGGFAPLGTPGIFNALSISGIVFSYLGFRQAIEFGGETRHPQRDLPIATIGAVVITMLIYVGLQIGFIGALDWHHAGVAPGHWAGLKSSAWAAAPFYKELTAFGIASLSAFGTVLLIDAGVSPSGTGWLYLGTSARANYGLSVAGYSPRIFERINRFGIPWFALLASAVIGCLFFIPAPSWYLLVGFITSATVLTMIVGSIAVPVLRRTAPELHRPFRLPWIWLWCPVGFLAAVEIIYWAGFTTLNSVEAATWIGLPLFAWYFAWKRGWINWAAGAVLGIVFLGAWVYVNDRGGWTLATGTSQRAGSWPFWLYDVAFSAAVLFFCVSLWLLSSREGRRHVQRAGWLVFLLLATFPLSYWGAYGETKSPLLGGFPWDTLLEVGVGLIAFGLAVVSGFATEEIREIVEAASDEPITRERLRDVA